MTAKKKTTKATTAAPESEPTEPRFAIREQGANLQIVDTTNGYVHAVTGARDEAEAMAEALNANPPQEEASATV